MSVTISTRPDPDASPPPESAGTPPIEPAAIREQLDRLLESPLFRNSKRYPALLRHVVEATLDGRASELKERLLGVQVFGRPTDYDTNADPVVRTSAAEVRKRMAQYYLGAGRQSELRIELPLGSYVPEFHWPVRDAPPPAVPFPAPAPVSRPGSAPAETPVTRGSSLVSARAIIAAAFAAIAVIALLWAKPWARPSALDDFWRPVFTSNVPVVVCVGQSQGGIPWPDAITLAHITSVIGERKHAFQIRREDRATFTELSEGPAILIGAFNDAWTLLLNQQSRFSFARDSSANWISDRYNISSRKWSVGSNRLDPQGHHIYDEDYAIVSRILDPRTGSLVVTAAGLHGYGTSAAGEFITRPDYFAQFAAGAPRGWQNRNIQIVLRTEVISGSAGPPRVVANYFW
ncbi:MAG TPA: hypothetical protein VG345_11210 [Bryobacteraceae bacterium]|nr:hypothetical protein [Bryobacteraceae bacterium]